MIGLFCGKCRGCLQLQVSFCKRATNYRAILRRKCRGCLNLQISSRKREGGKRNGSVVQFLNSQLHSHLKTLVRGMGKCRRCLQLQISFCKRATDYRALLRKMTYKEKAFYGSFATLYFKTLKRGIIRTSNFSKLSFTVPFCSNFSSNLTFQNFYSHFKTLIRGMEGAYNFSKFSSTDTVHGKLTSKVTFENIDSWGW